MTEPAKRIPIQDADIKTLKHFAEVQLGLDVPFGSNSRSVISKIKAAMPDCEDVPVLPEPPEPIVVIQAAPAPEPAPVPFVVPEGEDPLKRPAAISRPASGALAHASLDPKVTIEVAKTADKSRAHDVTISVNGDVTRLQRGVKVDVPYRVYLALKNAIEKQAIETDQVNPFTGQPIMSWEDVQSYPFQVHSMPSDEAIAAWEAATGDGFKNAA